MGYIYIITNKINNKQYIGQTLCEDIQTRWKQHRSKKSIGRCLKSAYLKYGLENFNFKIICISFDEALNELEINYIKKYNTISPNGYNLASGGRNKMTHPDTIKLISDKLKGRKLSKERCEKMREWMINNNPQKGKSLSEETKEKIRKFRLTNKIILSENSILKRNEALKKANNKMKKKVGQYDKNHKFIKEFESIKEASRNTNVSDIGIRNVCNHKKSYYTAGGFIWKFI